jgi:hypothetical protein
VEGGPSDSAVLPYKRPFRLCGGQKKSIVPPNIPLARCLTCDLSTRTHTARRIVLPVFLPTSKRVQREEPIQNRAPRPASAILCRRARPDVVRFAYARLQRAPIDRQSVIMKLVCDNMIRTQISLDEREYVIAKREAQTLGISVAEFVRRAVREALPPRGQGPWMRYAGLVETGNPSSSQSVDEIVYGQKD